MLAHHHTPASSPGMKARAAARPSSGTARCPISGARAQLQQPQRRQARAAAGSDDDASTSTSADDDLARLLKADMERFSSSAAAAAASSQQQQGMRPRGAPASFQQQQGANNRNTNKGGGGGEGEGEGGLKATLDKLLIADFFAVLAALAWLGVGLGEKAAFGSSRLVDAWMPLWPLLWQPLIGVLMAGALVSGGAGWLSSKQQEQQEQREQQEQQKRR